MGSGGLKVSNPRISYLPSSDTSPKSEVETLAAVYAFVIKCHASKKAAPENRPDAAKGTLNDRDEYKYTA